jgi:DNA-binding response OmpR family regulator
LGGRPEDGKRGKNARPRVLVVDDEPLAAEGLASFLRHRGYDAVTAADGFDALEKFLDHPADVLITDILMPRMDGFELAKKLRSENPGLPIIGITGRPDTAPPLSDWQSWIDRMVEKPIDLREFDDILKELLDPDS